jgi:protein TonB
VRRIRQTSPELSPAIFGRMSAAVAVSGALHVFLIYGFSLPADSSLGVRVTVIQARLASPQRYASPQRARTPEPTAVSEPYHSAPVLPSPPAPDAVAEPAVAPNPPTLPSDPEPAVSAGAQAASPTIPDPVHYPAKDLDLYPQALKRITPAYPQAARDAQVTGSVTLLVMIDEAGRVVGTSVMDAAPDGVFEQAAQQALADAAFFPAQKDGRAVRCRILMKIEFDPADAAQ